MQRDPIVHICVDLEQKFTRMYTPTPLGNYTIRQRGPGTMSVSGPYTTRESFKAIYTTNQQRLWFTHSLN